MGKEKMLGQIKQAQKYLYVTVLLYRLFKKLNSGSWLSVARETETNG